jgi:hypothetical protein
MCWPLSLASRGKNEGAREESLKAAAGWNLSGAGTGYGQFSRPSWSWARVVSGRWA